MNLRIFFTIFCPECGKSFETIRGLSLHFRRHLSPYCPICKENFKSIKAHIRQRDDPAHRLLFSLINSEYDENEIDFEATLSSRGDALSIFSNPEKIREKIVKEVVVR